METAARDRTERRADLLLLGAIVLLGLVLRLVQIGTEPFWHDEAWTAIFIRAPQARIWGWDPLDGGNPPLYYSLLAAWGSVAGFGEVALRLPAALFATLTIPAVYGVGRIVDSRWAGLVAAALVAVTPFQVRYGQEARTYALVTLCAAVVMLSLAYLLSTKGLGRRRRVAWAGYVLAAAVAALSHGTGLLILFAANVAVATSTRALGAERRAFLRRWLVAQLAALAIVDVWLPGFLRQWSGVYRDFWIPQPTPTWVLRQGKELFADQIPAVGGVVLVTLLGVLAALGLRRLWPRPPWAGVLLAFLLTAPVVEFLLSLSRPVLIARGLIVVALPLYILVGVGSAAIARDRRAWSMAILAGIAALTLWGTGLYFVRFLHPETDAVAALVRSELAQGDAIVFASVDLQVPFTHYFGADALGRIPHADAPVEISDLDAIAGADRVWYVGFPDASGDETLDRLRTEGTVIETVAFENVRVRLIDLAPPP